MPRPFLPDEIVRIVEMTWAEDPGQSAATVHRILDHEHGEGYVSLSKVQQIVRKTKQSGGGKFYPTRWIPWDSPECSADDIAHLFRVNRLCLDFKYRNLHEHEAYWARLLRETLDGLTLTFQFFVISLYAHRDQIGRNLGHDRPYTEDLDAFLTYRPWTDEGEIAYSNALERELVPPFSFEPFLRSKRRRIGRINVESNFVPTEVQMRPEKKKSNTWQDIWSYHPPSVATPRMESLEELAETFLQEELVG